MWIKVFVDYLRFERNLSERTVEAYQADLEAFKQFYKNLNSELSWKTVDSDIVRDWEVSMMDNGNSASSVNRRLSALRSFYRFLLMTHYTRRSLLICKINKPLRVSDSMPVNVSLRHDSCLFVYLCMLELRITCIVL